MASFNVSILFKTPPTTGFNSDFKEDFIWNVDTDSKKDS
jgi:hypothetical protein